MTSQLMDIRVNFWLLAFLVSVRACMRVGSVPHRTQGRRTHFTEVCLAVQLFVHFTNQCSVAPQPIHCVSRTKNFACCAWTACAPVRHKQVVSSDDVESERYVLCALMEAAKHSLVALFHHNVCGLIKALQRALFIAVCCFVADQWYSASFCIKIQRGHDSQQSLVHRS